MSYSKAWGANWKYCGQTQTASYFFDIDRIIRQDNIVRLWVKAVYSEKGRSDEGEKLGGEYSNLTDSIALVEIDCKNKWSHVSMLIVHSMEGEVIISGFRERERDFMVPGSALKTFYKTVCK